MDNLKEMQERRLVAILLSYPKEAAQIFAEFKDEHLILNAHYRMIVRAGREVFSRGAIPDRVNILQHLKDTSQRTDGMNKLMLACIGEPDVYPSAAFDVKRSLVDHHYCTQINRHPITSYETATEHAKTISDWARDRATEEEACRWHEVCDTAIAKQLAIKDEHEVWGFPWGLEKLDQYVSLEPSKLYVLGGIKKGAKSLFVLSTIIHNLYKDPPTPVALFSVEMTREAVWAKTASHLSGTDSRRIFTRFISRDEIAAIEARHGVLRSKPLLLNDNPSISTVGIQHQLTRWKAEHDLKDEQLIVVVDFLQIMDIMQKRNENEASAIKRAAYDLARIAKEFRCAVIAVAQLRNEAEGQEPHLRFLEGSGGIAQAAEAILLVDLVSRRESNYNEDWPKEFNIMVAAQRSGESGVRVNCLADLRVGTFVETMAS